jgi:hypothetical protein
MVHVLEHIIHPKKFLEKLRGRLDDQGVLIIEVPCFMKNPYDLLIADHSTHFTKETLSALLEASGFEVLFSSTELVQKELTVVATIQGRRGKETACLKTCTPEKSVLACIGWLDSNISDAVNASDKSDFGIFGTSIAGSWLFGELPGKVAFFVDEDPNRIGKRHLGCLVYHPRDIPEHSSVFIPFCPIQANKIKVRLEKMQKNVRFMVPSEVTGD